MDFGRLWNSKKVKAGVAVMLVIAVVSGAYLAFADEEPVEISNTEELQQIRENPSGDYVLADDIDLSHIDNFEPIEGFTGTFDGNGHTISNLTIYRPEARGVGFFGSVDDGTRLFGLVGSKGKVENVTLKDVNVTGNEGVGGIAGYNRGTVTESSVGGDVNVTGSNQVGGLVGSNAGVVTKSGVNGDVKGTAFAAGGLVGSNEGTVSQSYALGTVSGVQYVGGLVGSHTGKVTESYARNNVSGGGDVGGLVGWYRAMPEPEREGTIATSYATGNVRGDGNVGGLAGRKLVGDYPTDSYWDINTTGQNESDGGTPLNTAEMTGSAARDNMEGFDFGETWRTTESDYPILAWQDAEDYSPSYDEPPEDTSTNQTQMQSEDSTSTDLVSISGLIFKNRTVSSLKWYYLENRNDTTNPDGDDFTMQGIDTDGNVISSQSFDAPFQLLVSPSEESPIDTNVTGFALNEEYTLNIAKLRLVENGTTIDEFDPNVGLLRTAVESIPRSGFKQQDIAEQRRKTLLNEIDELESLLEDGNTQAAVRKMENNVKPSLDRWLKDGYEPETIMQLTKDEVLTTAEAVTERLRAQRERRSRR